MDFARFPCVCYSLPRLIQLSNRGQPKGILQHSMTKIIGEINRHYKTLICKTYALFLCSNVTVEYMKTILQSEHMRARLILRTPGLIPFETCTCSICWDQFFSRSCRNFSGLFTSNIPRFLSRFCWLICMNICKMYVVPNTGYHVIKKNNHIYATCHSCKLTTLQRWPDYVPLGHIFQRA